MRRRKSSIASSQNLQKARRRVWTVIAVACVAGLVVGALFIINATRQGVPPALAKDPADVLLRLSDLPAGSSLWVENREERVGSVIARNGFSFVPPEHQENIFGIGSVAEMWPSAGGAINEYNSLKRGFENAYFYYEPAPDDNYFWFVGELLSEGGEDLGWYVLGVCRKQGFVLRVAVGGTEQVSGISDLLRYIPPAELAKYLQTMADRAGGENMPHILPPPSPAENKDPSDVVLRQGDLPLYFVENLAERIESQNLSYSVFRTGDAWVTALVWKFSSEEDAHLFFEDNCGSVYSDNIRLVEVLAPVLGEESVLLRAEDVLVGYLWQEYRFRKGDFVVIMASNTTTESFDMVPYAAIMGSRI